MRYRYVVFIALIFLSGCALQKKTELPEARSFDSFKNTAAETTEDNAGSVPLPAVNTGHGDSLAEEPDATGDRIVASPAAINLAVPFEPQAPFADWSMPYKEACEEASVIMVDAYLQGTALTKEIMRDRITAIVDWQIKNWGGHYDLPIAKVSELTQALYGYTTKLIPDLTIEKIRIELQKGNPVIVPTAGRELGNPYFRQPGPLYHMLVIKGITSDGKFITNDPGTKRGADYVYDAEVLMKAMKDWTGSLPDGARRGLVLYK